MDILNGIFVFCGSVLVWINVFKLVKDKEVKGISVTVQTFFAIWGIWNIFYFYHLSLPYSMIANFILGLGNATWCAIVFYFKHRR